jgi:putative addiction module killer protein
MKRYSIVKSAEYLEWFEGLHDKWRKQVESRLSRIECEGHLGHTRYLEDGLAELKFNNGLRIYFVRTRVAEITLLMGGAKHGQDKDIKIAKRLAGQLD